MRRKGIYGNCLSLPGMGYASYAQSKENPMRLTWGQAKNDGEDTIILEPISATVYRIWSYEMDHEELHKKFGGSLYYRSRSGLSGAGHLPDTLQTAKLILPGTIDTRQWRWQFSPGEEIGAAYMHAQLYVPIVPHQGVRQDSCAVVTTLTQKGSCKIYETPPIVRRQGWHYFATYSSQQGSLQGKTENISWISI